MDTFADTWGPKYPQISLTWRKHWENLNTLFKYPDDKRKVFPADEFAMKVVYLAVIQASEKWAMPIQNWKPALNRFTIEFKDRLRRFHLTRAVTQSYEHSLKQLLKET